MSGKNWELKDFVQGSGAARIGRASGWLTFFLFVLAMLVVAGVSWAHFARIEEVARAEGRVVPSGRSRTVESLEGGIVQDILASEGDFVSAGQILIRIDDTGSSANLGELNAQRAALIAREHRLASEFRGEEFLSFEGTEVDPNSALAVREVGLFDSRRASLIGQRAVLEAQINQKQQEISELTSAQQRVSESLALLGEEIDLKTKSGVVPRTQILPLERERTLKRQEQDGLISRREQAAFALKEAQARLVEVETQRRAEISLERSDALNQLSVIDEAMKSASDVVTRAALRAPVNGVVSELNVFTIGAVIGPGEEVLRLLPLEEKLQVEARARPEDVAFVRPDQEASVKLTSFDFTIYGALPGRVVRVGADAEQDEATGEIYFPIIVETNENTLRAGSITHEIRPGMVASVDIHTGERTVLDYLLKPFRKARLEALRER